MPWAEINVVGNYCYVFLLTHPTTLMCDIYHVCSGLPIFSSPEPKAQR